MCVALKSSHFQVMFSWAKSDSMPASIFKVNIGFKVSFTETRPRFTISTASLV